MRSVVRAALVCFALALAPSCKVDGVVGERPHCEPACGAGEICDLERGSCVACLGDDDCSPDAGACVAGRCVECTSDSSCPGELSCVESRCVDPEDDDQEDEEEEEDQSGSSGEG
jgi:hypothetical protein